MLKKEHRLQGNITKSMKNKAAVLLGREGGKKKVPKGYAMASAEERSEAGQKGMMTRWGKKAEISLQLLFLPRTASFIWEAARKADPTCRSFREALSLVVLNAAVGNLEEIGIILKQVDTTKPVKENLAEADFDWLLRNTKRPELTVVEKP